MNADDIHIALMMSFFCFDFQIMFETSSEVKTLVSGAKDVSIDVLIISNYLKDIH